MMFLSFIYENSFCFVINIFQCIDSLDNNENETYAHSLTSSQKNKNWSNIFSFFACLNYYSIQQKYHSFL